jgi:hypothetical protein
VARAKMARRATATTPAPRAKRRVAEARAAARRAVVPVGPRRAEVQPGGAEEPQPEDGEGMEMLDRVEVETPEKEEAAAGREAR